MKNLVGLVLLLLVCLGLGITLITANKNSRAQKAKDSVTILTLSNQWLETKGQLEEQVQVNRLLEKDKEAQKQALEGSLAQLTNNFTLLSGNLAKTEATLKSTQEELARRDARIAQLEAQNQDLDKQAIDLSAAITNLTLQIAETQKKLANSEGEKVFLQSELKRMIAEKSELERQFNDLKILRAQVAKLKEELSIARRVEWIRQGIFASTEQKGAQRLMQGLHKPARSANTNYDLNVEVTSDGSVRVVAPLTNSPAR